MALARQEFVESFPVEWSPWALVELAEPEEQEFVECQDEETMVQLLQEF